MICLKCHQKKSLFFNGIRRTSDGCTGFTHFVLDIPRQISLYKNNVSNDCVVINSRNRKPEQLRENNLFITNFSVRYSLFCAVHLHTARYWRNNTDRQKHCSHWIYRLCSQ
ncbi:AAEL010400-PA [Aedes aegypti]|uniref:AAEL010400-PA n=1 Tax=Aedes aegypti TaxID=7159 RepID=Q16T36_AEDAE|nr:AAEL010400-PA [Aedes aegypti]